MSINPSLKKEKIGKVSVFFAMFVAIMLVQTPYMRIGTISAFLTIFLTLLAFCLNHNSIKLTKFNISLLVFLGIAFVRTSFNLELISFKLILQGIMCVVLASYKANERENEFLKRVLEIAALVYAVLIIISCIKMGDSKYIHGTIDLFNTSLDPNFVGFPLLMGAALFLSNIFDRKRLLVSLISFAVIVTSIFFTSSRGNAVAIIALCALKLILFLFNNKVPMIRKYFVFILSIAFLVIVFYYLSKILGDQWDRMSDFGEGFDNGRLSLWKQAIDMWADNIIFGVGLGGFVSEVGFATHNTYITVLVETGVVGLFFFISLIVSLIKKAWRCGESVFLMLFVVLLHMFTIDALDNRCVWAAIGFVCIYSIQQKRNLQ